MLKKVGKVKLMNFTFQTRWISSANECLAASQEGLLFHGVNWLGGLFRSLKRTEVHQNRK